MISTMGNLSLVTGGLSCVCVGLGTVVSVPLGIVTWVLASHDLGQMRRGIMNPAGKERPRRADRHSPGYCAGSDLRHLPRGVVVWSLVK